MQHTILLLHGALASEAQLKFLTRELPPFYAVHSFSFTGHAGRPLAAADFTMKCFAQEVTEFIQRQSLPPVHVFGYSMGGYAALSAAVTAPELFRSITTLGTKFDWSPATALGKCAGSMPRPCAKRHRKLWSSLRACTPLPPARVTNRHQRHAA
ncbi:alpha/beta hydrolase [Hymenobacter sp. 5516J-16]|uniref:alpha/beta fold hydrolase n=1 Tax=Hymenobacter sp. 5516J-16 TaxID=2932253 RepID=UPI001FD40668|nr:alpha/beta hydrolase [Hymenobacter sp. 5516J-16]UOQ77600.1 alpha/beta hydrolase [Hymenobacter sp. 5516J-16]